MKKFPDASFDAVVTDPPYGTGGWKRDSPSLGKDPSATLVKESWDEFDLGWLAEAFRVSRGPVIFFLPQTRLREALAEIGDRRWRLLIWCKTDPRPRAAPGPWYGIEPILAVGPLRGAGPDWFAASAPRVGRDADGVGHPCQKPIRLMRWRLRMSVGRGGAILDPFAGSGSTGVAALAEVVRFTGIDADASWIEVAKKRCHLDVSQLAAFAR